MRWMRWIFVRNAVIAVNAVKINISSHFTLFLTKIHREIHRISYKNSPQMISKVNSIWFKFTRNFKDVSYRWLSGLSSWRHAGGQRFAPVWEGFFCNNTEKKINNSPRFTAFTAKRCKKYAMKIICFHRILPHSLRKFTPKPWPGLTYAHRPMFLEPLVKIKGHLYGLKNLFHAGSNYWSQVPVRLVQYFSKWFQTPRYAG